MAYEPNPTAARRELALYFRTLRERQGLRLDELAEQLGVSEVQASRVDRGVRGLRAEDVRKLAALYHLPDSERDRLLDLVAESHKRGWWQQVDLTDIGGESYRTLIGMEQAAELITEYGSGAVPGLLQTREYATAMASASSLDLPKDQIELGVDVRMRRQRILDRGKPPRLWVVVDEAVLARVTGGRRIMRDQLNHLVAAASRPGITVQVINFEYGTHPGVNSHFIRVETGGDLPDLVYVEGLRGRTETTTEAELQRYRNVWDTLRAIALSPRESHDLILDYAERLSPDPRQGGEDPKEEEQNDPP